MGKITQNPFFDLKVLFQGDARNGMGAQRRHAIDLQAVHTHPLADTVGMASEGAVYPPLGTRGIGRRMSVGHGHGHDGVNMYQGMSHARGGDEPKRLRPKRNETKSESELRKLKKENARLQEVLSTTQQTPREEVTCKEEIEVARKDVVQLKLAYNQAAAERQKKEKQLNQIKEKMLTIGLELGNDSETSSPTQSPAKAKAPASAAASPAKLTDEHSVASLKSDDGGILAILEHRDRLLEELKELVTGTTNAGFMHQQLMYMLHRHSNRKAGMGSQYSSLRKELSILGRQQHDIELNIRTLEHAQIATREKIGDVLDEIRKSQKKRVELQTQYQDKLKRQDQIQKYLQSREINRKHLIRELDGEYEMDDDPSANADQNPENDEMFKMMEDFVTQLAKRLGESDVENALKKLELLTNPQSGLQEQKGEKEQRLESLQKDHVLLEKQLKEIETSGTDFSFSMHEIDELEGKVNTADRRLSQALHVHTTVQRRIYPVQFGIESIHAKLDPLRIRAPGREDQPKVEVKTEKSTLPMMPSTAMEKGHGGHETHDKALEEEEDPLVQQLESVEQKLVKIMDSLETETSGEYAGASHTQTGSSDHERVKSAAPDLQANQYNFRVALSTPPLFSAPSSAGGAYDPEALSDDDMLDVPPSGRKSVVMVDAARKPPSKAAGSGLNKADVQRRKSKIAVPVNSSPKARKPKRNSTLRSGQNA